MSNSEDLAAINSYVNSAASQPAAGAPNTVIARRDELVAKWNGWYPGVSGSWYVSDDDLANGKAIRNAIMSNNDPAGKRWVDAVAADKPGATPETRQTWAEKPDVPKYKKDPKTGKEMPWVDVPLTYPKAKADKPKATGYQEKPTDKPTGTGKAEDKPVETVKAGFMPQWISDLPLWVKVLAGLGAAVGIGKATKVI